MAAPSSLPTILPPPPSVPAPEQPLTHLLNAFSPSPETIVLLLAVAIGGGTGMAIVTFHYLIILIHHLAILDLMGALSHWGAWTLALIPTLGGIVVGLMRWRWSNFGSDIKSLLADKQGIKQVSLQQPITKIIAASISLGTGASLGPEGPSVEVGGSIGMLLGQVLQVSRERQKLLLGAGAAAGLAAGFNAPIAGVFFALELVLGATFTTSSMGIVLLAAVVSAFVAQIGLGGQPAFTLPAYDVRSPLELPFYIGLGVLASLVSVAYTQTLQRMRLCFSGQVPAVAWLGKIPKYIQPVIGGLFVGLVALQFPQIMGTGYETIEAILQDVDLSLGLLIILLVVKLITTATSLGSGLVGGIFAPAMFLGAALGAAYGKFLGMVVSPDFIAVAEPPAYAMVGMAAVLAGSVNAPLTAILLLFELTRDYRIVLPLMATVGLSVWLVERYKPVLIPTPNVQPTLGLDSTKNPDQELLQKITVREVMQAPLMVTESVSIFNTGLLLTRKRQRSALVVNEAQQLIGIITLQDVNRAITSGAKNSQYLHETSLGELCTRELLYAHPEENLAEALTRMAARGLHQLPVVNLQQPQKILGLLDQDNIALACAISTTRQALTHCVTLPLVPMTEETDSLGTDFLNLQEIEEIKKIKEIKDLEDLRINKLDKPDSGSIADLVAPKCLEI